MRLSPALMTHAETLLGELLSSTFPADSVVSRYFRQHAKLGHGDRGFIAESVYGVLRRKRSLAARCGESADRVKLLRAYLACVQGMNLRELEPILSGPDRAWLAEAKACRLETLPPAVRLYFPDWLYEVLVGLYDAGELVQ